MEKLAYYLFWSGLISTGVSSLGYLLAVLGARLVSYRLAATDVGVAVAVRANGNGSTPWALMGSTFAWLAAAFLTGTLAFRWAAAGHPPLANMWEYTVAFGWGVSLFHVLFERRFRQANLGVVIMPVALVLLAVSAVFFPAQVKPLVPALQANRVLAAHVGTMMLSYSILSVSFGAAVLYLVQGERRRPDGRPSGRFARLPAAETLEEVGYRSVLVGFPLMALGIALGAYWGSSAWGRYWGWDPKETSALVTWLVYAGYLHARGMRGWRGRRAAWLLIGGFAAVLFSYFAVNLWISGLHSYAGV